MPDLDTAAPCFNIQRIFPQASDAGWEAFGERDQETFVDRLGNLVLLETSPNQGLANAAYASKRPGLAASAITNTRQLAERFENWTPEALAVRQAQIGRAATGIWRVSQMARITAY